MGSFNRVRLHESLENLPPAEREARYAMREPLEGLFRATDPLRWPLASAAEWLPSRRWSAPAGETAPNRRRVPAPSAVDASRSPSSGLVALTPTLTALCCHELPTNETHIARFRGTRCGSDGQRAQASKIDPPQPCKNARVSKYPRVWTLRTPPLRVPWASQPKGVLNCTDKWQG